MERFFAEVVRPPVFPAPLSGANRIPLGLCKNRVSVFNRITFPRKSVFQRLAPRVLEERPKLKEKMIPENLHCCPRCLSDGHRREECRSPIRCHACHTSGHVAASCTGAGVKPQRLAASNGSMETGNNKDKSASGDVAGWFGKSPKPGPSKPPSFNSFGELWKAHSPSWAGIDLVSPVTVPWVIPESLPVDPSKLATPGALPLCLEPSSWSLATPSPSFSAVNNLQENPDLPPQCNSSPPPFTSCWQDIMAYERCDPRPFVPREMPWNDVVNRPTMVRAVASRRLQRFNEDLAIITINPLPGNIFHFPTINEIIREYLENIRRIEVTEVQPCSLGEAYVRFDRVLDRDNLVAQGPLQHGDVSLTFVKQNEGRNWRRVLFNTECWLMLLGFPPDYQGDDFIQDAIGDFAKLIYRQKGSSHKTRVIVKVRVLDLQSVPHFVVFTESLRHDSDSWTIQCEVLQSNLLGVAPRMKILSLTYQLEMVLLLLSMVLDNPGLVHRSLMSSSSKMVTGMTGSSSSNRINSTIRGNRPWYRSNSNSSLVSRFRMQLVNQWICQT